MSQSVGSAIIHEPRCQRKVEASRICPANSQLYARLDCEALIVSVDRYFITLKCEL